MKRKSITMAIAVLAGILVIQMMFWVSCSRQTSDQDSLTARITSVPFIPPEEIPTYDELAQRQKEAVARLALQQELLPSTISSADVTEEVLRFARTSGVTALPLHSVPVSVEDIDGNEYLVMRVNISAEGDLSNLLNFIDMLEDGTIKALTVDQTAVLQTEDSWSADIDMIVYAQPSAERNSMTETVTQGSG